VNIFTQPDGECSRRQDGNTAGVRMRRNRHMYCAT
jgi:hypothetical protein